MVRVSIGHIVCFLVLATPLFVRAHGNHDHDEEEEEEHDHDHDHSHVVKSTCGIVKVKEDYDQAMHIAAIFIVLAVSLLGSFLPVLSSHVSCLRNCRSGLEFLNSFGFGVVIATAFIHMIPSGMETLSNKCLGLSYHGLGMVIAVLTILFMQLLETELVLSLTKRAPEVLAANGEVNATVAKADSDGYTESTTPEAVALQHNHHHHHHHINSMELHDADTRKKINVLIFEVGVAIHSIIIGLDLGVSGGSGFKTLLIAICFHQFFEGVAVGSSAITAFANVRSSIITATVYSLTTPVGVAIGIGVHSTYSYTSLTSLWVRGILDSIAGGILIYTGIVELLTYQYTINQGFHEKRTGVRSLHYTFLWLGAAAMSIIGFWA